MEGEANLKDVLRFALAHTNSECPDSTVQEINKEKHEYFNNVLKSMTVDVMVEFNNAIQSLKNPSLNATEKLNSLNVVREYIDNMDIANNFVKSGGTGILLDCLKADEPNIRTTAMYIIAEMSQNNPTCQQHFIEAQIIPLLLSQLNSDENITSSALHAISSIVRNSKQGYEELKKNNGAKDIVNSLCTTHQRVFIKASFIIASLSMEYTDLRDEFTNMNAIPLLIDCIENIHGFDIKLETALYALSELTKSSKWNAKPEVKNKLEKVLNLIIKSNEGLAECEEMTSYANDILKNLKP